MSRPRSWSQYPNFVESKYQVRGNLNILTILVYVTVWIMNFFYQTLAKKIFLSEAPKLWNYISQDLGADGFINTDREINQKQA
jgi:hypothetical protein